MHDVLRGDGPLRALPWIGPQPWASYLAAKDARVTDTNVSSHRANQLCMSDLREMSKWRTG